MKRKIYNLLSSAVPGVFVLAMSLFSGSVVAQSTYTFNYTGGLQTINLPPGNYSVECWGADGGDATNGTAPMSGGKGGYASGIFANPTTQVINVYVGGHGGNASGASNVGGGGGGMSDIATAANPTLIIIAAGAGGGATSGSASEASTGGDGGGLTGASAIDGTGVSTGSVASGGSQTAGGVAGAGSYGAGFPGGYGYGGGSANGTSNPASPSGTMHAGGGAGGNGGNGGWNGGGGGCTSTGGNDHSAGGGAGYYGGGGGRGDGGAGGGGSSYIGGVTSGTTIMFGQPGFITNPDPTGHGVVKITELCGMSLFAANNTNSLNPVICAGQSATLMTDAVSNYSWSTGATTSSLVVSPTSNTVYVLTATSTQTCTTSRTISITVSAGLPVLSITNPSTNICLGQSATLTASGALTYTWANAGVTNGQSFIPSATAVYTVTGGNGCGTSSAVTTVSVSPLAVFATSSSSLVCEGTSATLSAVSSVSGYTWEPGTIAGSNVVVAPMAPTVYTVTASDGICSGTQTVLVSTKTTPNISITQTLITMCLGESAVLVANGAGTGGSYSWTPGNATTNSITVAPTTNTLYNVVGTNSLNCSSSAQVPIIIVQPLPLNVTTNGTLICAGSTVSLSASGSTSYSWTNGPSTANYQVIQTAALNVYTVTGYNTTNTCTATKTVEIAAVIPNLSVSSPSSICEGGSATVTATGANTYTFNGVPTGSINVFTANPVITTTYVLIANTNSISVVCPSTQSIVIAVDPNPTISITPKRNVMCRGESNTLTAIGAANYVWQGTLGTNSTAVVSPNSTTSYSLTGTNSFGCSTATMVTVIVSTCNGLEEMTNVSTLSVYPNPNAGTFTIKSDAPRSLNVVNALGQVVLSLELNSDNGYQADVNNLAKGLYFLMTSSDSQSSVQGKILVE